MASEPLALFSAIPVDLIERALALVSIPVANVVAADGGFAVAASNREFREAGLAPGGALPAGLAAPVRAFLDGPDLRRDFDWADGGSVDGRSFRVTAARSGTALSNRCMLSLVDQTARERSERSLRREMATDSLTGLPNREGFGDLLDLAALERGGGGRAVLVVDLRRFGRLNACLGGLAGDELLISVARRIKGTLRARDALARIGGDEFGVLLAIDEDRVEAEHAAKRIERALRTPFRLSGYQIRVDCAVGIAHGGADADGEELIRHAQFANKRAGESGRIETYQAQAFTAARARFSMETRLRRAIENGALRLHYQPIHDLGTGRIVSMEALARWRDEDGVDVPPSEFIPVAEESGLVVPLGRWAIEEATRTLAGWDARAGGGGCGVQVAVNLSPIQLARDRLVGVVERALAQSGLAGGRLKLELTESALVSEPDRVAGIMRALKGLGATIAMDDFGTGYSNLAFLQRLPIDILKIDRSFVTGMLADRDKLAIVRAVLSLAQALGMRTIAEGVEGYELARTLGALGCHLGQGFHFSRPVDAEAAYALVAADRASAIA